MLVYVRAQILSKGERERDRHTHTRNMLFYAPSMQHELRVRAVLELQVSEIAFHLSDCIPFLPFRPNHLQGLPRVPDFMQSAMVLPAHVVDDGSRKILEKV